MPLPEFKQLAEKTNKSVKEIKDLFKQAQAQAYESFNNESGDFNDFSIKILNQLLGINVEESGYSDHLINVGKSLNNALTNSGALETLVNLGFTALTGANGKQLNDTLGTSKKLTNKSNNWFHDLSAQAQKKYKEEHPNSEVVEDNKIKPISVKKPKELEQDKKLNEKKSENLETQKKEVKLENNESEPPIEPKQPEKPIESERPKKSKRPTKSKRSRFGKKLKRYSSTSEYSIVAYLIEQDQKMSSGQITIASVKCNKYQNLKNTVLASSKQDDVLNVRKTWLNALNSISKNQVIATQLEVMYKLGAPETIFSMLVKDVKKRGNGFELSYFNNEGRLQKNVITATCELNRKLIKIISNLIKDKDLDYPLWTTKAKVLISSESKVPAYSYKYKVVTAYEADALLKSISNRKMTLSNVRTSLGDSLIKKLLTNCKIDNVEQASFENEYKRVMKVVAYNIAKHTQTSLKLSDVVKDYVSANLQREVFKTLKLKVPSYIPKN